MVPAIYSPGVYVIAITGLRECAPCSIASDFVDVSRAKSMHRTATHIQRDDKTFASRASDSVADESRAGSKLNRSLHGPRISRRPA
jgi:hypothetical protein